VVAEFASPNTLVRLPWRGGNFLRDGRSGGRRSRICYTVFDRFASLDCFRRVGVLESLPETKDPREDERVKVAMKSHRLARLSEAIREVAANAILFEIKDPRVKNVTVTRAEVSADLQHAKVYVSIMGSEKEQQLTMHGLRSAAGFIQTKVADRLTTRYVPHITFILDEGVKKSIEIARLIREANEQSAAAAGIVPTDEDVPADLDETTEHPTEQSGSASGSAAERPV